MFDSYIYKFLDWLQTSIEKFREWMIQRSLPKAESPKEWLKKNAKRR
jgi:hypothetical protein